MSTTSSDATPPAALPILARGKHRNPSRGACFMEYTSVLAGEPFSDSPGCVDTELAAVLRGANDTLSDRERAALVPLLGRAIGLVVPRPAGRPSGGWLHRLGRRRTEDDREWAAATGQLHRAVAERFAAALDLPEGTAGPGRQPRLGRMFWDLMSEPTPVATTSSYVARLRERLELLHTCYEDAVRSMGIGTSGSSAAAPGPARLTGGPVPLAPGH